MAREASPEKTRMPWKRMEVVRLLFGGFAVAVVVIGEFWNDTGRGQEPRTVCRIKPY